MKARKMKKVGVILGDYIYDFNKGKISTLATPGLSILLYRTQCLGYSSVLNLSPIDLARSQT